MMSRCAALLHAGKPPAVALATAQRELRALDEAGLRAELAALRTRVAAEPDGGRDPAAGAAHRIFGADLVDDVRPPIDTSVWAPFVYVGP